MKGSASLTIVSAMMACGQLAPGASDGAGDGTDASAARNPANDASATTSHDGSAPSPGVDAAAPPQSDGICAQTAMSAGTFDADCVYLLGTLNPGDAWRDALIHVDRPNDFATGFGYMARAPIVRPSDGRLLFEARGDQLPEHVYRYTTASTGLPNPSLASQTIEPGVMCSPDLLDRIFVFPDDGAILYQCGTQVFVSGSPTPLDLHGRTPIATGRNRLVVTATTYPDIALVQNGVVTPVLDLTGSPYAFRSRPSGTMYMATGGFGIRGELREIALDGTTQVIGAYDFGPEPFGPGPNCALEPSGALVCINDLDRSDFDAQGVVRFTINDPPEVLYDHRKGVVKIHIAQMVTGP